MDSQMMVPCYKLLILLICLWQ